MKHSPFTIELTHEEIVMVDTIQFDPLAFRNNHQAFNDNANVAYRLVTSLLERDAIPEQRIRYFSDPKYNPGGRGNSRKQTFERNGTRGNAMLRHPHFLKYLRYFIHGSNLPLSILAAFTQAVEDCGVITSGDIEPLGATARQLAHTYRLDSKTAADEFFKLCLDLNLGPDSAGRIRASVQQLRKTH